MLRQWFQWLCVSTVLTTAAGVAMAQEIAVVMAPGSAEISKVDLANLYLGRTPGVVLFDLPEGSPVRATFYQLATDRSTAQIKSLWSRLVFTGKAAMPKELPDAAAVKKSVAATPNAVGYIEKSAVDSSVKVVHVLP